MTAPRIIPPDVRRVQVEAADPDVSAFVSANAGSGKTHVLAQRVINLLLRGVDPAKISASLSPRRPPPTWPTRVQQLAGWTALDDAALDEQIRLSHRRRSLTRASARARGGCLLPRWRRRAG